MLIGIDANEANIENRDGIGRYAYNLLRGVYDLNEKNKNAHQFLIYLKSPPLPQLPGPSPNWQYRVLRPSFLWSQLALPIHLIRASNRPQLLFTTSHYLPFISTIASIVSIMDLSYLPYPKLFKFSDLYKLKNWTAASIRKAKKIITISNFSKREIIKYYFVDPARIVVAYPGVDRDLYKPKKLHGKKDFILYVGTLQPRKNIKGLIKAYSLSQNLDKLRLVIAGAKGWLYHDIFTEVKNRGLVGKIIFSEYVSEKELISFYQNAVCLVLPSFYEGFGIPVIEAFACGCPVIASNSSSLPEIVGNAGLLIDPNQPASIATAIDSVCSDQHLRQSLIKKGLIRSKSFNWENTAKIVYT